MSEITVTLPKSDYDGMQKRLNELNKNLQLLEDVVSKNQYFSKTVDSFTQVVYYRPLDNDEVIFTLETKFIEAEQRYVNEIRTLKTLVEQKNAVIFDLNDRIKEIETAIVIEKEPVVEQHPTVSASCTTTTMYIPKPPKKSWWKKIWSKIF
jgi:hypothetical protein